ncbi:hypothetical protein PF007_g29098 [Phytophthora fragariae]|uniref:Uncharacterized protein n=1 Tax=Phytophthora fragariae TaxID=53985 RepID=A0A6A3PW48_9STRA|nr:hypothetical protein PF007_g29098 [Phytophthora fragariae]
MINLPEEADIFLTGEQLVRNRLTDKNKRIRWHANNTEFRRLRSPRSEMIDLSVDAPSAEHMFSSFEDAVGELSKKFNVTPLNKEDSAKEVQERRQERLKLIKAQIEQISDDETSTKRLTHFERQRRQTVLYKERLVRGRVLTASEKKERRARKFQQEFERSTAAVELLSDGEDKQKALRELESPR